MSSDNLFKSTRTKVLAGIAAGFLASGPSYSGRVSAEEIKSVPQDSTIVKPIEVDSTKTGDGFLTIGKADSTIGSQNTRFKFVRDSTRTDSLVKIIQNKLAEKGLRDSVDAQYYTPDSVAFKFKNFNFKLPLDSLSTVNVNYVPSEFDSVNFDNGRKVIGARINSEPDEKRLRNKVSVRGVKAINSNGKLHPNYGVGSKMLKGYQATVHSVEAPMPKGIKKGNTDSRAGILANIKSQTGLEYGKDPMLFVTLAKGKLELKPSIYDLTPFSNVKRKISFGNVTEYKLEDVLDKETGVINRDTRAFLKQNSDNLFVGPEGQIYLMGGKDSLSYLPKEAFSGLMSRLFPKTEKVVPKYTGADSLNGELTKNRAYSDSLQARLKAIEDARNTDEVKRPFVSGNVSYQPGFNGDMQMINGEFVFALKGFSLGVGYGQSLDDEGSRREIEDVTGFYKTNLTEETSKTSKELTVKAGKEFNLVHIGNLEALVTPFVGGKRVEELTSKKTEIVIYGKDGGEVSRDKFKIDGKKSSFDYGAGVEVAVPIYGVSAGFIGADYYKNQGLKLKAGVSVGLDRWKR